MRINRAEYNKWIKALKSGKYKQTTFSLQNAYGYCCLGVACKVLIPKDKLVLGAGELCMLGGLPSEQPYSPAWLKDINMDFADKVGNRLSNLNDDCGLTFKEMAIEIEKVYGKAK